MTGSVYTSGSVSRVPNKRKPGQKMITFWLPADEFDAFKEAITTNDDTATEILRRAVTTYVKRAEKQREAGQ